MQRRRPQTLLSSPQPHFASALEGRLVGYGTAPFCALCLDDTGRIYTLEAGPDALLRQQIYSLGKGATFTIYHPYAGMQDAFLLGVTNSASHSILAFYRGGSCVSTLNIPAPMVNLVLSGTTIIGACLGQKLLFITLKDEKLSLSETFESNIALGGRLLERYTSHLTEAFRVACRLIALDAGEVPILYEVQKHAFLLFGNGVLLVFRGRALVMYAILHSYIRAPLHSSLSVSQKEEMQLSALIPAVSLTTFGLSMALVGYNNGYVQLYSLVRLRDDMGMTTTTPDSHFDLHIALAASQTLSATLRPDAYGLTHRRVSSLLPVYLHYHTSTDEASRGYLPTELISSQLSSSPSQGLNPSEGRMAHCNLAFLATIDASEYVFILTLLPEIKLVSAVRPDYDFQTPMVHLITGLFLVVTESFCDKFCVILADGSVVVAKLPPSLLIRSADIYEDDLNIADTPPIDHLICQAEPKASSIRNPRGSVGALAPLRRVAARGQVTPQFRKAALEYTLPSILSASQGRPLSKRREDMSALKRPLAQEFLYYKVDVGGAPPPVSRFVMNFTMAHSPLVNWSTGTSRMPKPVFSQLQLLERTQTDLPILSRDSTPARPLFPKQGNSSKDVVVSTEMIHIPHRSGWISTLADADNPHPNTAMSSSATPARSYYVLRSERDEWSLGDICEPVEIIPSSPVQYDRGSRQSDIRTVYPHLQRENTEIAYSSPDLSSSLTFLSSPGPTSAGFHGYTPISVVLPPQGDPLGGFHFDSLRTLPARFHLNRTQALRDWFDRICGKIEDVRYHSTWHGRRRPFSYYVVNLNDSLAQSLSGQDGIHSMHQHRRCRTPELTRPRTTDLCSTLDLAATLLGPERSTSSYSTVSMTDLSMNEANAESERQKDDLTVANLTKTPLSDQRPNLTRTALLSAGKIMDSSNTQQEGQDTQETREGNDSAYDMVDRESIDTPPNLLNDFLQTDLKHFDWNRSGSDSDNAKSAQDAQGDRGAREKQLGITTTPSSNKLNPSDTSSSSVAPFQEGPVDQAPDQSSRSGLGHQKSPSRNPQCFVAHEHASTLDGTSAPVFYEPTEDQSRVGGAGTASLGGLLGDETSGISDQVAGKQPLLFPATLYTTEKGMDDATHSLDGARNDSDKSYHGETDSNSFVEQDEFEDQNAIGCKDGHWHEYGDRCERKRKTNSGDFLEASWNRKRVEGDHSRHPSDQPEGPGKYELPVYHPMIFDDLGFHMHLRRKLATNPNGSLSGGPLCSGVGILQALRPHTYLDDGDEYRKRDYDEGGGILMEFHASPGNYQAMLLHVVKALEQRRSYFENMEPRPIQMYRGSRYYGSFLAPLLRCLYQPRNSQVIADCFGCVPSLVSARPRSAMAWLGLRREPSDIFEVWDILCAKEAPVVLNQVLASRRTSPRRNLPWRSAEGIKPLDAFRTDIDDELPEGEIDARTYTKVIQHFLSTMRNRGVDPGVALVDLNNIEAYSQTLSQLFAGLFQVERFETDEHIRNLEDVALQRGDVQTYGLTINPLLFSAYLEPKGGSKGDVTSPTNLMDHQLRVRRTKPKDSNMAISPSDIVIPYDMELRYNEIAPGYAYQFAGLFIEVPLLPPYRFERDVPLASLLQDFLSKSLELRATEKNDSKYAEETLFSLQERAEGMQKMPPPALDLQFLRLMHPVLYRSFSDLVLSDIVTREYLDADVYGLTLLSQCITGVVTEEALFSSQLEASSCLQVDDLNIAMPAQPLPVPEHDILVGDTFASGDEARPNLVILEQDGAVSPSKYRTVIATGRDYVYEASQKYYSQVHMTSRVTPLTLMPMAGAVRDFLIDSLTSLPTALRAQVQHCSEDGGRFRKELLQMLPLTYLQACLLQRSAKALLRFVRNLPDDSSEQTPAWQRLMRRPCDGVFASAQERRRTMDLCATTLLGTYFVGARMRQLLAWRIQGFDAKEPRPSHSLKLTELEARYNTIEISRGYSRDLERALEFSDRYEKKLRAAVDEAGPYLLRYGSLYICLHGDSGRLLPSAAERLYRCALVHTFVLLYAGGYHYVTEEALGLVSWQITHLPLSLLDDFRDAVERPDGRLVLHDDIPNDLVPRLVECIRPFTAVHGTLALPDLLMILFDTSYDQTVRFINRLVFIELRLRTDRVAFTKLLETASSTDTEFLLAWNSTELTLRSDSKALPSIQESQSDTSVFHSSILEPAGTYSHPTAPVVGVDSRQDRFIPFDVLGGIRNLIAPGFSSEQSALCASLLGSSCRYSDHSSQISSDSITSDLSGDHSTDLLQSGIGGNAHLIEMSDNSLSILEDPDSHVASQELTNVTKKLRVLDSILSPDTFRCDDSTDFATPIRALAARETRITAIRRGRKCIDRDSDPGLLLGKQAFYP